MFLRRLRWAQLIRTGVPPLYVLRPVAGGFTPPAMGDEYPAPDLTDKTQMARARQMYEQRRIGTWPELEVVLAKSGRTPPSADHATKDAAPAKTRKEKAYGRG